MKQTPSASASPKIVVLGGSSAIAEAACRLWAERGASLLLAGRDAGRLSAIAQDLRFRGGIVDTLAVDLAGGKPEADFAEMVSKLGGVDAVLLAYGVLGEQALAETNAQDAERILQTDFTSAAVWCLAAANVLEKQNHGALVVIGSVAGDRGRASNYVYGAAKGGLGILVQGIAHRLARSGARAVLIKPGFVDTPMTAHIGNKGALWAKPEVIAKYILKAADSSQRVGPIIYAPPFWRWIMYVIRSVPSPIFHRTKL